METMKTMACGALVMGVLALVVVGLAEAMTRFGVLAGLSPLLVGLCYVLGSLVRSKDY